MLLISLHSQCVLRFLAIFFPYILISVPVAFFTFAILRDLGCALFLFEPLLALFDVASSIILLNCSSVGYLTLRFLHFSEIFGIIIPGYFSGFLISLAGLITDTLKLPIIQHFLFVAVLLFFNVKLAIFTTFIKIYIIFIFIIYLKYL